MKRTFFAIILWLCGCFFFYVSSAQIKFQRTYGGNDYDEGRSVKQTWDGGYIIAGSTSSFGAGATDVFLIKVDSLGNLQWQKTFGGNNIEKGYSLDITSDSGYVICGYTNSFGSGGYDVYLIRTNQYGDTLWTKTYGGTDWDFGYSVKQTSDGGFVIAGGTYSFGNGDEDVYIVKTNSVGDTLWTKAYGGNNTEVANDIQLTLDNSFIVCGNTTSFGSGLSDVYLLKINTSGSLIWTRVYGGINEEEANSVQQTSDGGYIVAGFTNTFSTPGYESFYLIKTDGNGDSLWTKIEQATDDKRATSVVERYYGGYALTGVTTGQGEPDALFWLTYASGDWFGSGSAGGIGNDIGYAIQQTSDHGFIIVGSTLSFGQGVPNVYLVKNDSTGAHPVYDFIKDTFSAKGHISVYPNPVTVSSTIMIDGIHNLGDLNLFIFNALGIEVKQYPATAENIFRINRETLPSGVYFFKIMDRDSIAGIGKIVIQ